MVNEAPMKGGKTGGGQCRRSLSKTLNQHLEVAVEEAEKSLLRGQYRRALKDANRCLVFALSQHQKHQQEEASSLRDDEADDDDDCFRVEAPLYFPFVFDDDNNTRRQQQPLYICIDFLRSDAVDRAAAVALQSWYEVSQRITMDAPVVQESHLRLLQPFWKVYGCSTSHQKDSATLLTTPARSCSLELAVVLVQFCRATAHVRESIELALVTLDHVLSSSGDAHYFYRLLREEQQFPLIHELLSYLLCNLMPYMDDERTVEAALKRLSEPSSIRDGAKEEQKTQASLVKAWTLSDRFNPNAARIVARFLHNPPIHWPDEIQDALESFRQQLEEKLAAFQQDHCCRRGSEEERISSAFATDRAVNIWDRSLLSAATETDLLAPLAVPMSGVRDAASGRFERLPTLGWDATTSFRLGLFRLAYVTRIAFIEPLVLSQKRWSNRGTLAVSVWALCMAWKERGRFYRGTKLALRLVLKPLREILDAIIPNHQRR